MCVPSINKNLFKQKIIPRTSGIYKIINLIDKKSYIGSAINLYNRKNTHFSKLRSNKHHNVYLQNSFNCFGESSFKFEILELCSKKELLQTEQKWINIFFDGQKKCYNINSYAGSWLGRSHTSETRKKMSFSHSGKTISKETKEKMSRSHLGKKHLKETKEKIAAKSRESQQTLESCYQWGRTGKLSAHRKTTIVTLPDGNKKIFFTVKSAGEYAGVNPSTITKAIKRREGFVKKYQFQIIENLKYKKYTRKKPNSGEKNKNAKKVLVIAPDGHHRVFQTVNSAADFIGSPSSSLSRALHGSGFLRGHAIKIL